MRTIRLAVAILLAASVAAAAPKPYLSGLIQLMPANDHIAGHATLSHAWIDGYRLRIGWNTIQPTNSTNFVWSHIDQDITTAVANGKVLSISIAAGIQTPSWVYTSEGGPAADEFPIDTDGDGIDESTMPLGFDPKYQAKWEAFITALGARYDGNATVRQIFINGAGNYQNEFYVCKTTPNINAWNAAAVAAGFADKSAAIRAAYDWVLALFVEHFPNTPTLFTEGNPWGGQGGAADNAYCEQATIAVPDTLRGRARSTRAATITHINPPIGLVLPYPNGSQCLFSSADHTKFYRPIIPDPWPPDPIPIYDMTQNAYDLGDQYLELYAFDSLNSVNYTAPNFTLQTQRLKLIANVPDPAGPGGVQQPKLRNAGRKAFLIR